MPGVYRSNKIRISEDNNLKDIKIEDLSPNDKVVFYNYYFERFDSYSFEVIKRKGVLYSYSFDIKEGNLEVYHTNSIIAMPEQKIILNDGSGIALKDLDQDFIVLFSEIYKYDVKKYIYTTGKMFFDHKFMRNDVYSIKTNNKYLVVINGFLVECEW